MDLGREEFEALLDAKLDPLKETIARLEKSQEDIVKLMTNQARQDETIKHMQTDIAACVKQHDEAFGRLRALEADTGKKTWEILKLLATGIITLAVGLLLGKAIKG